MAGSRTFRVFVSSTFTDLKAERDCLHRQVFPRLRSLCQQRGSRFQAIDLRWGVSEEAGFDQHTMDICLGEIARCQQTAPRPNFIVLLGDRYGWRPLPERIPATEFETLEARLGDSERQDLREWYRRDDNAVPPAYALQPRSGVHQDGEVWSTVERRLHALFAEALGSLPEIRADRRKFELSAVEQEIAAGALTVPDAQTHVFCFFRRIASLPGDASASGFVDLVKPDANDPATWTADEDSSTRLHVLKDMLRRALPGNCFEYDAEWTGRCGPSTTHLDQLAEDVYSTLARIIDVELAGLEVVEDLHREIDAHARFGAERARIFVGRTDISARISAYLAKTDRHPLVVHGGPGSGKSALLAHVAEQARTASSNRAVLVIRFIGATPESSDVRSMLSGLCRQVSRAYQADEGDVPTDYQGLVLRFPKCLALATDDRPLVLILDALDQLSERDDVRLLAWLPTELPPHVSMVASTLLPEMLASVLPESSLVPLPLMTAGEGDALLRGWLKGAGRTLQDAQCKELLDRFSKEGLPLYLRLAFEEARHWPSFFPAGEIVLRADTPGLIRALFERLAFGANHGNVLVARSLGQLAAARNGLTEDELLDVLSPPFDSDVLSDLRDRSPESPTVDRLPVVLWSRLYFDLAPYLIERSADGTSLMTFYHRQFQQAAEQVYLGTPHDSRECHRRLAVYFGSQQLEYARDDRRVSNLRALTELPFQQNHAELWPALFATLTDFRFLQNKTAAGQQLQGDAPRVATTAYTGIYDLQADFELALQRWPGRRPVTTAGDSFDTNQSQDVLAAFARALQQEAHVVSRWPDLLWQQLRNRLQVGSPLMEQVLSGEAVSRCAPGAQPWLQLNSRPRESETLLRTLTGHTSSVNACAVSPDGTWIVSAGEDGVVRIWDSRSGRARASVRLHSMAVQACAVGANGSWIVSAGTEYPLRVWDSRTGAEICSLFGHVSSISSLAISADGSFIASADWDGRLKLWNRNGPARATLIGHSRKVHQWAITCRAGSLADSVIAPDGSFIVAVDHDDVPSHLSFDDRLLRVWDSATGLERATLRGHTSTVTGCAVSHDGSFIISASEDRTLRIWESSTGQNRAILTGHTKSVSACAIAPDSTWIVSGAEDGSVRIWDSLTGRERATLAGHDEAVAGCAVSYDGATIVTLDRNRVLKVWNSRTGGPARATLLGDARWAMYWTLTADAGAFAHCAVSADGSIVVAGDTDGTLRVWDSRTGRELLSLRGHKSQVAACAISLNGSFIVSIDERGTLIIWDRRTGRVRAVQDGQASPASACAITTDGSHIVSGGNDGLLRILNSKTGSLRTSLRAHSNRVSACAVSHDGSFFVSAAEEHPLRVWDSRTGRERASLRGHTRDVRTCAVSPDGSFIVSGDDDGSLRIWDSTTLDERRSIAGSGRGITACAVSRDSSFIVWGGDNLLVSESRSGVELARLEGSGAATGCAVGPDGTWIVAAFAHARALKIWDSRTGIERATLEGHAGPVNACAVSPDGTFMVSGGDDCSVRIWDARTGAERATFKDHDKQVTCCAVGPDGRWIVSGSKDQTLKIWRVPDGPVERARAGHAGSVQGCGVGPDGTWFMTLSGSDVAIWDASTGLERKRLRLSSERGAGIMACRLSPDGARLVLAQSGMRRRPSGNVAVIIDLETGRERAVLTGHNSWVSDCAFSPDGSFVVSASDDGTIKVWDAETGQQQPVPLTGRRASGAPPRLWADGIHAHLSEAPSVGECEACAVSPDGSWVIAGNYEGRAIVLDLLTGRKWSVPDQHTHQITACAVAPHGAFMVSSSADRTLRVLDLPTGRERAALRGHEGPVTDCAISPDGRYILSVGEDATLRVWESAGGAQRAMLVLPATLACVALHPWRPVAICGDAIGNVYQSAIIGIEYGPIVATAVRSGNALILRCPFCRDSIFVTPEQLGQPMNCAQPGCGGSIYVNSFVA